MTTRNDAKRREATCGYIESRQLGSGGKAGTYTTIARAVKESAGLL
jgi:hypothetical protein